MKIAQGTKPALLAQWLLDGNRGTMAEMSAATGVSVSFLRQHLIPAMLAEQHIEVAYLRPVAGGGVPSKVWAVGRYLPEISSRKKRVSAKAPPPLNVPTLHEGQAILARALASRPVLATIFWSQAA
jgi:hypothetical protein